MYFGIELDNCGWMGLVSHVMLSSRFETAHQRSRTIRWNIRWGARRIRNYPDFCPDCALLVRVLYPRRGCHRKLQPADGNPSGGAGRQGQEAQQRHPAVHELEGIRAGAGRG